jgi:hypothetical protein
MINKKKLRPMLDRRSLEQMIEDERRFSKERSDKAIQKAKLVLGSFKSLENVYTDGRIVKEESVLTESGHTINVVTVQIDGNFQSSRK